MIPPPSVLPAWFYIMRNVFARKIIKYTVVLNTRDILSFDRKSAFNVRTVVYIKKKKTHTHNYNNIRGKK